MGKGWVKDDDRLVSVIVPIFDVEPYLVKCLESICGQSYEDLDIILVDDGGRDGCPAICDRYAQKDSRIRVIHKKNGGLSDARNAGIDVHRGAHIFFVDPDDLIHPDTIKDLLDIAIREDADIVECNVQKIEEGKEMEWDVLDRTDDKIVYDHDRAIESFLDYRSWIVVWNKLYRSDLFDDIRFPVDRLHEDEFVTPYLVDRCSRYVWVDNKYYVYLQRKNSIMNSGFDLRRLDILVAQKQRLTYFSKKYEGRYDDIIKYHFFVSCVNLRLLMKSGFKNSETEKAYIWIYKDIMKSKKMKMDKKLKAYAYRYLPRLMNIKRN